ncbi:M56 family metallopeptidase [Kribbella sp. NPDC055071]
MTVWVYLPFLLSLLLPWAATWTARLVQPAVATGVVVVATVVTTSAYVCSLTVLSLTLFDDLPPLSALDHRPGLGLPEPVPDWLAVIAVVVLLVGGTRLVHRLAGRQRVVRELRAGGTPRGGLAVADLPEPFAIAVPGRPGHVLVTSGMLRLLTGPERKVMLAHERSHLNRGHHRLVGAVDCAAAMNPLLSRLVDLTAYLVERAADEDAAEQVGDREVVARAVARASLATAGATPARGLGFHGTHAMERVSAIAEPRGDTHWRGLIGVSALSCGQLLVATVAVVKFIDVAHAWLAHSR